MEEIRLPSARSKNDQILVLSRRLEIYTSLSTVAKSFCNGWKQKRICYSAMKMIFCITLFWKKLSWCTAIVIGIRSTVFCFSPFTKFAKLLQLSCPSRPPTSGIREHMKCSVPVIGHIATELNLLLGPSVILHQYEGQIYQHNMDRRWLMSTDLECRAKRRNG